MKKKVFILAGLCAIGLCAWEAQANNHQSTSIINVEDNVPTEFETIVLHGSLMMGVNPNSITAGANENSVYLHFSQSFGNVSISIYNEMGNRVYGTVVNTNVQSTVIIPFSGMNTGMFILSIDNTTGYAEGDFIQD